MTQWRLAVKPPEHLRAGDSGSGRTITRALGGGLTSLLGARNALKGRAEITKPYGESGWVHACVKPFGLACTQAPLEFWQGDPKLDRAARRLPPDHPLHVRFRSPNPLHTQAAFFEACAIHRKLDGYDAWLLLDEKGEPIAKPGDAVIKLPATIMPFRGRSLSYTTNNLGWPSEYLISLWGNGSMRVSPRSLVIFRDYDPDDPLGGQSDVDAALSEIDLDWQAQRYQRSIIEHSGDPGGFIITEGQLGQPEERALKNLAKEEFRVDRAGEWRHLSGKGVTYQPNKMTPRDMEFRSLQEWTRDKIAAILGVPPPIIGVLDNATLANINQCMEMFWLGGNGVLAYLQSVEDGINGHFLPRIIDRAVPEGVVARFNTSGIKALQENKYTQLETAKAMAAAVPGLSIHDALKLVGRDSDPLQYGDVRLVSQTLVPIENVMAGDTLPNSGGEDDANGETTPPKDDKKPPKSDDEKAAHALVTREAEEPVEDQAFKARTAYWEKREAQYARRGRATVKAKYLRWSRRYEEAQLKRLRAFAKDGPAALRAVQREADDSVLDPANLGAASADPLLVPRDQWSKNMRTTLEATLHDIFDDALADMSEELEVPPIGPEDPRVLLELERQIIQLAEGHTTVLAERVRAALLDGLSHATSTGTLQQLVLEVLPELEESLKNAYGNREARALAIARTETGKASSSARDMQMREAGITRTEWVSSRDSAVRGTPGGPYADAQFSHYELDGKVVALGSPFDQAKHPNLTRPHDPHGEAGDVINCRCYARPVEENE